MRAVWVAALLSCCAACAAQGKDDGLRSVRQRIEASDFRATGRLVRVNGPARVTTAKFSLKGHWFPDGLRLLYDFDVPGGAPKRVLLHMDEHGRMTVTEGKGADLDLAFEDLLEGQFFWAAQTMGTTGTVGSRTCTEVKSVPASSDRSRYAAVTSCIDPSIGWPLKVDKTLRVGAARQEVTYSGLRQSSGVWIATEIRMQAAGGGASTLLLIDHGTARAKLSIKDFDLKQPAAAGEN